MRGWDDPRLPTLAGMRRRGLVPEGINSLCREIGITRSEGYVQLKRLYHHVRLQLDASSPRALAVLRPLRLVRDIPQCGAPDGYRSGRVRQAGWASGVCRAASRDAGMKVQCMGTAADVSAPTYAAASWQGSAGVQVVDNLPDDHVEEVKALDFPGRGDAGYMVPFSKVCYIEATDFRETDAKDFFGLAPGKSIMLRCARLAAATCAPRHSPACHCGTGAQLHVQPLPYSPRSLLPGSRMTRRHRPGGEATV